MPMFLVASLLLVQAPAATPASQQPIDVNGQKKAKQICKVIEVTGSRMRQRVCKKEGGDFDLGPNVSGGAPGMFKQQPVAQPGGLAGPSPQ